MPKVDSDNNLCTNTAPLQAGTDQIDACGPATTINIYRLYMPTPDHQYSQTLPTTTYQVIAQARTALDVRYSFNAGVVEDVSGSAMTLKSGTKYDSGPVRLTGAILYAAASSGSPVLEIEAHS